MFAVPVASIQAAEVLTREADEFVAVETPADLMAIGAWYRDFHRVENGEVAAWLQGARAGAVEEAAVMADEEDTISIDVDGTQIVGTLAIPIGATGIVVFAHGSGSSRFSHATATSRRCSTRRVSGRC